MYIYTLEVLVKFQLKLLIIIYKSKIHLVNTKCWTQQTLTQYTIHQSNQIKSRKFIFIFSSFYIYFFLNFIKFEVIFFNTSLIDRLFFFSFFFFSFFFLYYFYLYYFGSPSTLFYSLNLDQRTLFHCSVNHSFLDRIISNNFLSFLFINMSYLIFLNGFLYFKSYLFVYCQLSIITL